MDEDKFLSAEKALLIAPAGYGKTHFISRAVQALDSKQLILTHTHAGVASIKEKLRKNDVPKDLYQVETISSFAQRFTFAYYTGDDVPSHETKEHFPFVIGKATELLDRELIAKVVINTYGGVFVDEYQDCTERQHQFVKKLAELVPTRLLGDHLQGIFNLNSEALVNLQCPEQMAGFIDTLEELNDTPWRWQNTNRSDLGEAIMSIRDNLENGQSINLDDFPAIEHVLGDEIDLLNWQSGYGQQIKALSEEKNLLLIHPRSESPHFRLKVIKTYLNRFYMIEAIDDSNFYELSRKIDMASPNNYLEIVESILDGLVNKTELQKWLTSGKLVNKKIEKLQKWEIERYEALRNASKAYEESPSLNTLKEFMATSKNLPRIKCYRGEILTSLFHSMTDAFQSGTTVEEAMIQNRNRLRRLGRRVVGRCIGTTLLTKGLEFETVGVLSAQLFSCPKHFYVAISRASRRLIIFSNSKILNPY